MMYALGTEWVTTVLLRMEAQAFVWSFDGHIVAMHERSLLTIPKHGKQLS